MAAIINIQIIALITLIFNLKIQENGLQKKKKNTKINQEKLPTNEPLFKRKPTKIRNPQNKEETNISTSSRRNKALIQRDDLGNV